MAYDFSKLNKRTEEIKEWLKSEYASVRTGRATPNIVDHVMVDSYGSLMPIKNVAQIAVEDAKTLRITPWDSSQVKAIEKAVTLADIGLSAVVDDKGLRLVFPELTGETREKLAKVVKQKMEEARISLRKEREEVWEDIQSKEKAGDMTEDEKFTNKEKMQKIIDDANAELEKTSDAKEKEVMTV